MSTNADKFLADLVMEFVPLPTSVFLVLFIDNGDFSVDWVRLVLSIEVSDLANFLKP